MAQAYEQRVATGRLLGLCRTCGLRPFFSLLSAMEGYQRRKKTAAGSHKKSNVAKPRRCCDELRRFARSALPRSGVRKNVKVKKQRVQRLSDSELIDAVKRSAASALRGT